MNSMKRTIFTLLVALCPLIVQAQDTLNVDEAIQRALENNFAIRIAQNNADVAVNNNTLGNAGFLPVVNATGNYTHRVQNTVTDFANENIADINNSGVTNTVYAYGVDASWTIFDGLTMFATSDRLQSQMDISEEQAQLQIEQVLATIISTYFQLVGQQQAYRVLENTVDVSQERIRIAETKLDLGSGSEYDLLQARADFNADRAALIRANTGLKQAKILVNQILVEEVNLDFNVQDNIELSGQLQVEQLEEEALLQNKELSISRLNEEVASAEIREITGEWFPQISVNGGYGYTRNEASVGFTQFSENKGFTFGVSASMNLFNGFNKRRRRQNAQIELKNEQLRLEELELTVQAQVRQVYEQYADALDLMKLENENLQYTQQSLDIALERFRLGTINSVELREAQLSLLNAENRLIASQIEAKTAEIELLRLSGRLLQRVN